MKLNKTLSIEIPRLARQRNGIGIFLEIENVCNFQTTTVMINIISASLTIMVKNIVSSIAFYESIGLKIMQCKSHSYAMLETSGLTIGIRPRGNENFSSETVSIGFIITDINDAKEILAKNKILPKYEEEGRFGIYLHFTDPDGTILYFVQPKWDST